MKDQRMIINRSQAYSFNHYLYYNVNVARDVLCNNNKCRELESLNFIYTCKVQTKID